VPKVIEIDFEKLRRELWGKATEVAQVLGIAPENLSRKLRGHHRLTLEELNQISLYLNRDTSDFLMLRSTPSPKSKEAKMLERRAIVLKQLEAGEISVVEAEQMLDTPDDDEDDAEAPVVAMQGGEARLNLSLDDLIRLREHEVEPEWIKALVEAGLTDLSIDEICQLAEHEVDVEWFKAIREAGFTDLSFEEVILLAEHEVDAHWLRELRKEGFTGLSIDDVVRLAEHEVDSNWLRELRKEGFTDLSIDEVIHLAEHEVDVDWLKRMRAAGLSFSARRG